MVLNNLKETYIKGEYICRQGSYGDTFYIISEGSVRISQEIKGNSGQTPKKGNKTETEKQLRILSKGDYFGEKALLSSGGSCRTANVVSQGCECLVLDKTSFFSLIGDLGELRYERSLHTHLFTDMISLRTQR